MTTNPSPPHGSEKFDCDEIERHLKEISPWPWKWECEDSTLVALGSVENTLKDHVLSAWRCKACANRDNQCLWPNKIDSDFIAKSPQRLAAAVKRIRELENIINEMDKLNKESKVIIENILKSSDEG